MSKISKVGFVNMLVSPQHDRVNYEIIAAGKASLSYAKGGIEEYLKRLRRYGKFQLTLVKDGDSESVSKRLLDASQGSYRVAMDERGQDLTSLQFSQKTQEWANKPGIKKVCFLIGASDGHTTELRNTVDLTLRLSKMTMQHELALVVLLEQIYRSQTILRGEPYHR